MRILRGAALALGLIFGVGSANAAELRIGLAAEPSSIDPHFHALTPNNALLSHLFERLVEADEKGGMKPGLAESWKAINETTWEIKLRKGVKWHDGSDFTADDVLFSFERPPNVPNSPSSFAYATKGKTFRKIDDHTVQVVTAAAYPLMPNDLSAVFIVSKKHVTGAKTEDFNSGKVAIGTGAYKFSKHVQGDRTEFVRNDAYWGKKPAWEKVSFRVIKSGPSRIAALKAGDVDVIEDVPTNDIEGLKKDAKFEVSQSVSSRLIYFHMDHFRDESPFIKAKDGSAIKNPLKDKRVRLALSMAINRDAIIARVMEGVAIKASQFLPTGYFGISPNLKPVDFDLEGAKKLLAEAGFANGFKLTIHGPNGRYTNDAKIIEVIAQMLARLGIDAAVETMPPAVFFRRASIGAPGQLPEFSFILVGWNPGTGENSGSLKPLVVTFNKDKGTGTANRGRYSNPEVDKLVIEALSTIDDDKRAALLGKATEIAIGDVAVIPLHYQVVTWSSKKGIAVTARTDEETRATGMSPR
ncbi:MAG: ABC transporter substrate-binding protein [Hyphomicrobiaceae bacterium]|nr:MAG: ABC transporter substrate-binding protein [Hyphomicrobiaceae bacterium]